MKNYIPNIARLTGLILIASVAVLAVLTVSCKTKMPAVANAPAPSGFYTCGMHPELRSLDPYGTCPFCKMPLIPAETVEVTDPDTGKTYNAATFPAVSGYFSCPAHPEVLSHDAGDKCPICGKPLLPVESPVFKRDK